jgi:transcription-repair coupling factor (superfamily II helicase)
MSLSKLFEALGDTPSVRKVVGSLREGEKRIQLSGLEVSSRSLLLAHLFRSLRRPVVTIASSEESAQGLFEDLKSLLGTDGVRLFPSWGIEPYELKTPYPENSGGRLECVDELRRGKRPFLVTTPKALIEKTITPQMLENSSIHLKEGIDFGHQELANRLIDLSFNRVPLVEEVGDFSVRGGIIDLFPNSSEHPIRVEFWGDTVESLREFSVNTQRSKRKLPEFDLRPQREFLIDWKELHSKLRSIRGKLSPELGERLHDEGGLEGLEWLAPLLGIPQATLFDYLPEDTIVVMEEPDLVAGDLESLVERAAGNHSELVGKYGELPPVEASYLLHAEGGSGSADDLLHQLIDRYQRVELQTFTLEGNPVRIETHPQESYPSLNQFKKRLEDYLSEGVRVFLCCTNPGQRERIAELLDQLSGRIELPVAELEAGFSFPEARVAVLTDHQIFPRHRVRERRRRFREGIALQSYRSLSEGDYVVHIDYGIGKYLRLETITVEGRRRDCLLVVYLGGDKLYVPIEQFNRVQKYAGKEGHPALTKIGGVSWQKAKARAKNAIMDMASELIKIYAERRARPGFACAADTPWQRELEVSFRYEETPDQVRAVEEVKRDMEASFPMDRLICGDVGYGKTEVAVRAAFKAVDNGKQVAMLVPTTILAQQHYATFSERLASFPVKIEMLSRFKSKREQKRILEEMKAGTCDVVVGTHRLLSKDIEFKDLGLVIVDEEQRFGVRHKEKLKRWRTLVDVLTLTATPIPRTMQLSLYGARDTSVINTPPKDRLPIHTQLAKFSPDIIVEAIQRELSRGGQVYFVHNRVQSIEAVHRYLQNLLPAVRIAVAHGQMPESRLERIMLQFLEGHYQVLLSTTIIESGLDIPSVNTMVVARADKLGLAQLYQLRGRVGRSSLRAYAHLLVPAPRFLSPTARKRLKAVEEFTELGSGFHLALRDLEIRGAGNLLGPQQHGFIEEVGFDLYTKLLEEAVAELKGQPVERELPIRVDLDCEVYLPEEYIHEKPHRVQAYQMLAEVKTERDLEELKSELADRFGKPPPEMKELFLLTEIRMLGVRLKLERISLRGGRLTLSFHPEAAITKERVQLFLSRLREPVEFASGDRFQAVISVSAKGEGEKIQKVREVLRRLATG